MNILVCSIEDQWIGLEINQINSVILAVETTSLQNAQDYLLGMINVHGNITPVLDMRRLLGLPVKELEIKDQFILCNIHQKQMALWIDHVLYVKNYKEEPTPPDPCLPKSFALQCIFKEEDGRIILIYNLEKLTHSNYDKI